jgi:hypothetical protein
VDVSLWGYDESTIEPKLIYITTLENNGKNDGTVRRRNAVILSYFSTNRPCVPPVSIQP